MSTSIEGNFPPWHNKQALLIYKDGRILLEWRQYDSPTVKLAEVWPYHKACTPTECPLPILGRTFRFIGVAGPYAVYEEVY